ncbi:MAG TPA: hypothetical protein VKV28_04310 [Candidatus Binataceae bacterium]|nr:hypothetical protein [Candidatus Binataceae bacterium]
MKLAHPVDTGSRRRAPALVAVGMALLMFAGCSLNSGYGSIPGARQPFLRSFLGLPFGADLAQARQRYPSGMVRTSPMGFTCYQVRGLSGQGIQYPTVLYEFTPQDGMQMVLASFTADSSALVFTRLKKILGSPSRELGGSGADDVPRLALWPNRDGGQVRFDGRRQLLIVRNQASKALAQDLSLRLENDSDPLD